MENDDGRKRIADETLYLHQELLTEARSQKAWREGVFMPWKTEIDTWRGKMEERVEGLEAFDHRVISDARGNEETMLAELANVKREVMVKVEAVGKDLEGARQLAGKLPAIESQIASAQTMLTIASKNVNVDAAARKRWRKYSPVITALVAAVMTSLAQRFGLPPAAANDPHALLPGATPTVSVK